MGLSDSFPLKETSRIKSYGLNPGLDLTDDFLADVRAGHI